MDWYSRGKEEWTTTDGMARTRAALCSQLSGYFEMVDLSRRDKAMISPDDSGLARGKPTALK